MWFQICFSIVLVHVIGTNLAKHDPKDVNDPNKEETEAIFANVIKNISRVNHVLQELINNYEHLQNIYKSQENLESESSDGEIDEVYKNKNNTGGRERSKSDPPATPRADGYLATQMIWSDKDEDSENNDSNSDEVKASKNKIIEPAPIKPPEAKQKQAEIIFVDTHKDTTKKKKRKIIEPVIEIPTTKVSKTRYNKVSYVQSDSINQQKHRSKKKKDKEYLRIEDPTDYVKMSSELNNSEPKTNLKITIEPKRNVEKKLHSEIFSPINIWDEIISNKPIQLQSHNELTFEKLRKDNNDNSSKQVIRQRSRDTKPPLAIPAKKNQTEKSKIATTESSDSDVDGGKEEFQATVLREAYGDACLKVVVRKCFKACKAAGKDVCERYKCKSNYKEKFNQYIKTGCTKEFQGSDSKNLDNNASESNFRGQDQIRYGVKSRSATTSNPVEFNDVTRNRYLRACLPHLQTGSRRSGELKEASPTVVPSIPGDPLPKFNILRDKYEESCQKISRTKCKKACKYASKKICESFTCNSARKKAYKKKCNEECKSAYKKGRSHASTSDSSDGSSDSSGSGSSNSS